MASFVNFEDETGESVTGLRITLESGIIIWGRSYYRAPTCKIMGRAKWISINLFYLEKTGLNWEKMF